MDFMTKFVFFLMTLNIPKIPSYLDIHFIPLPNSGSEKENNGKSEQNQGTLYACRTSSNEPPVQQL
jgi:hypothetical protein